MFCLNVYPPKTCDKSIMSANIALSHEENEHTKSLITVHKTDIYNNNNIFKKIFIYFRIQSNFLLKCKCINFKIICGQNR